MARIVQTLMHRRATVSLLLKSLRAERMAKIVELAKVDAEIAALDPAFDFSAYDRPPPAKAGVLDPWFRPKEAMYLALDVLAIHGGQMTTTDLAQAILATKGANPTREEYVRLCRKLVTCLSRKHREGTLRRIGRVQGVNRAILWEAMPPG